MDVLICDQITTTWRRISCLFLLTDATSTPVRFFQMKKPLAFSEIACRLWWQFGLGVILFARKSGTSEAFVHRARTHAWPAARRAYAFRCSPFVTPVRTHVHAARYPWWTHNQQTWTWSNLMHPWWLIFMQSINQQRTIHTHQIL